MSNPRVSIVLPTLNGGRFLAERLATIKSQTFLHWELIVVDSHSCDGTWETLSAESAHDSRIILTQAPPDGIYPNWNRGVQQARGEFIYIATADDTMESTFLERMAATLDAHPECDIAQCCLHAIDDQGSVIPDWWKLIGAARFLGEDYLRPHVRLAPYDGILHAAMHTIYHSITQLLIRRRAFDRTGPFPENFGPSGDFLWGMKAGLTCNVVHVPEFLATWRIHAAQASSGYRQTPAERAHMGAMVDAALKWAAKGNRTSPLPKAALLFPYRYDFYRMRYAASNSIVAKFAILVQLLCEPTTAWFTAKVVASGQRRTFDRAAYTRRLLCNLKLSHNLVSIQL